MGVLIGNVARKERRDTAALWASNNPVPLAGEWCLEADTGNVKIGDGVLTWNVLSYVNQIVQTFDISAGNQTMTLPKITVYPQEYNFFWTGGDGTFTATLAVTNSETVGGIVAATWTGEGEGSISCVSNGTNWEVKDYSDYLGTVNNWENVSKGKDGQYKSGNFYPNSTNIPEATMWAILSEYLSVTTIDTAAVSGVYESSTATFIASKAIRTDSITISISTYNSTVGTLTTITIKSDTSGNWDDTNEVTLNFELTGARWRT